MFVYAALLVILCGALVASMALRTPVILDVIRDRNTLYRELPNGIIENIYTLKIINQSDDPRSFTLTVSGVDGIALDGVEDVVLVDGGGVSSMPVRARAHRDNANGINKIVFRIDAVDDASVVMREDSRFLGPTP